MPGSSRTKGFDNCPWSVTMKRDRNNSPISFQALVGTFAGVRVANAVGLGKSFAVWPKGPRLESPGQRPGDARHDLDVFLGP